MTPAATDVLVVGAGPTGLAAANLLGRFGVGTVVLEREAEVAGEPRAVSIDDEAMRLLQWVGLADGAAPVVMPGTGTRYYGGRGQLLAETAVAPVPRLGHPPKNPIDHGAFTRLLRDGAVAHPTVDVRFGSRLVGLEQGPDGVRATVRDADGESPLEASYVLGCDGGRSTVRALLGIGLDGRSLEQPWLVIDTVGDPHDERYAMHHGDPERPHVVLPGGRGRCRYEFLLLDGEDEETATSFAMAQRLLGAYRPRLTPDDVVRQRVYVFHALIASRWRDGRAFLLGDAAHMMPPFAGQGLNTGLRDAANLAWKVAAVVQRRLGEHVLDSYEQERRPHAEAMIRLSVRRGRAIMTTSRREALVRDVATAVVRRMPPLRRRLDRLRVKPHTRYAEGLLDRPRDDADARIVGELLPQPRVLLPDGRLERLDDVLGPWFALIAVEPAPEAFREPHAPSFGVTRVRLALDERFPPLTAADEPHAVADADGLLAPLLDGCRGRIVVVRPDKYVMGTLRPGEVSLPLWRPEPGDVAERGRLRDAEHQADRSTA